MHQVQVQLSDQIYDQVKRRADEAGFRSVDEYVTDVITNDSEEEFENLDHLFTPERLAHIDAVIAKIDAGGKTYTMEEMRENLANNRAEVIRKNGR